MCLAGHGDGGGGGGGDGGGGVGGGGESGLITGTGSVVLWSGWSEVPPRSPDLLQLMPTADHSAADVCGVMCSRGNNPFNIYFNIYRS